MTIYISIVEILLKKPDLKHYAYEDHDYTYFRENDEFISYHFLKKSLNAIFSGALTPDIFLNLEKLYKTLGNLQYKLEYIQGHFDVSRYFAPLEVA